ncbi:carboxylesterase/lipase family protein [Ottowia sp. SB7-C50]|uniref:carboxylesterase/lipase family protein n=1 Tax=Ottowia sp. SB7-C50 TaxID=3081231 RepID=UPI002952D96B|nr:carboxylesterase family protein [Ottowia sp. SB7-C50]WOP14832.1 carboxylesterase family protein [Ottowia sp. SB7-C50]
MRPITRFAWLGAAAMATTLILSGCGSSGSDPQSRTTQYGDVEGVNDSAASGTYFWKGLPYAKPPVGALRWKAPVAPASWTHTLQAKTFGASCIQNPRLYSPGNNNTFDATVGDNLVSGNTPGSEDCLSLNIWRPATADKNLPVIVFIHGGSNITGYTADPMYDGAALARKANAVVVSANYRLGQLGFFRHPALRDKTVDPTLTAEDQSGNYAVLDIIQALKFVQGNIGEFGGDKGNVTLTGQSAGAINILAVMTAPANRAAGLFHKIAPLSGGISVATSPGFPQPPNNLAGNNGYIPALNPVATYEALSNMLLMKLLIDDGSAADVASATAWVQSHSNADIAAYLRGKPASKILQVGVKTVGGLGNTTGSGPIPEGTVVASDPIAAIVAGNYVKVPVLSGLTHSESKLLSSFLPLVGRPVGIKLPDAQLFPILFDATKAKNATFGDIINPAYANGAAYDAAIAELDAKFFIALRDNYMNALMAQTPTQIWSYRFDWKQEAAPWNDVYGAAHAFDLPFLFGNFGPSLYANVIGGTANQTGRLALSDAMMSTLAAFARDGNPNNATLGVTWPNWPKVLLFDATPTAKQISVQ